MNFDLIRSNSTILHVLPINSEKKRGGLALQLVAHLGHLGVVVGVVVQTVRVAGEVTLMIGGIDHLLLVPRQVY